MAFVAVQRVFAAEWEIVRPTINFDRSEFSGAGMVERVKTVGNISGWKEKWNPVAGWMEYDVETPQSGWYEFIVPVDLWGMEYFVDGKLIPFSNGGQKISNLWLESGKHVFRIQRWSWTGFEVKFDKWILKASVPSIGRNVRMLITDGRSIVRVGEEVKLSILCGGNSAAGKITAKLIDMATKQALSGKDIEIPASPRPVEIAAPLACPKEGIYDLALFEGDRQIPANETPPIQIVVVDTKAPARGGELKKTLISEIDCVATGPQYAGDGGSKVVDGSPGKYRESGDIGFLAAQHQGRDSGWFAYKFAVPEAGKPYIVETDSPDDAFRTFCVAIREAVTGAYPVAGGMDTGDCYSLSNKMQTQSILIWPKTTDLRVVFMTAHTGRRGAAAAKIRVYRVDNELPLLDVPATGGRTFANWYEEGSNYVAVYGADRSAAGILTAVDRWARSISYMGGDMLVPTVSVYQMSMYPSNYNVAFCSSATFDNVRILLMKCEKYGMGMIGEFHPECRDLDHLADPSFTKEPRTNYLVNKDGYSRQKWDETPRFHPLDPIDQKWYVGMVGEFADRYKDSPALRGVSLRLMGWANPALNNFHSLDWGYDDLAVGMFEKETGLSTGAKADDPKRFQARYAWLMANAKDRWIQWRCQKIAEIYTMARDRLRRSRPDLKVYSDVFELSLDAGIDPKLLGAIDGVVLINSRYGYGRQGYTYEGPMADHRVRDNLLDQAKLLSMKKPDGSAAFMFGSRYFEATEAVVTPESLGFPQGTKRTWMSGVVNPTGRHYLERYAIALAQSDATYLADGGNAYTLGQPILREFMLEYRKLPSVSFKSRPDAIDPAAVRELQRKEDFLFYTVNSERYSINVNISLKKGNGPVRRLATGEEVLLKDGLLSLELKPYQLLAFQAPAGTEITKVTTVIPAEDKKLVESMVSVLQNIGEDADAGNVTLDEDGKKLLGKSIEEANLCLKEGRYWRARTLMENSRLAEKVYNRALVFPPGLEYLADPTKARLIKVKNLARPKDPLVYLKFDQIDAGKTTVAGKLAALQAVCEGAVELQEGKVGKAIRLDGKTGRVVLQGDAAAGLNLKNFTVSVWVNAEEPGRRGIISRRTWPVGYELFFWNGSLALEAGSAGGSTPSVCRTGDSIYRPGEWYHIAATIESGKMITLFVDGAEVKQAPLPQIMDLPSGQFLIGWNGWGGIQNDPTPGWFAGKIDELRVFDRVLTPEEIMAEWAGKRE
jgi:hypothetical protein